MLLNFFIPITTSVKTEDRLQKRAKKGLGFRKPEIRNRGQKAVSNVCNYEAEGNCSRSRRSVAEGTRDLISSGRVHIDTPEAHAAMLSAVVATLCVHRDMCIKTRG